MEDAYLLTMRCPVYRRRDSHSGSRTELETLIGDVKGKRTSGDPTRPKVPMRRSGSDRPILVMKWGIQRCSLFRGVDPPLDGKFLLNQ